MKYQHSVGYHRQIIQQTEVGPVQALRELRKSMKEMALQQVPPGETIQKVSWYGHDVQDIRVITVEVETKGDG